VSARISSGRRLVADCCLVLGLVAAFTTLVAGTRLATAGPIVVSEQFDFRIDDGRSTGGAWTASHSGGGPPAERWKWVGPSRRDTGRWAETSPHGRSQPGRGNYLTSPVIDAASLLGQSGDTFRISLAQRFSFDRTSKGQPLAAGEIAYSLDGGSFIPIPTSAFTHGGSILSAEFEGLASPFATTPRLVNQRAFVAPSGTWSGPPPLLSGGGLFTGRSPTCIRDASVPTEAILDFTGTGLSFETIQFRLVAADIGSGGKRPPRSRWDVRYFQVDIAAPEPSGLAIGGGGCAVTALAWLHRRRRLLAARPLRPRLRLRPSDTTCR
jgi:hypothetical protein